MKYKKFTVENYKGITDPIEIDVEKNSLIPIIGINECGKTTLLNAIYAFDHWNDWQNETYFHLDDILNLYKVSNNNCIISALIGTNKQELKDILKSGLQLTDANSEDLLKIFDDKKTFDVFVSRKFFFNNNERSYKYEFSPKLNFKSSSIETTFCEQIISNLPYILYFDDFRETFPDEIEINEEKQNLGWLPIIQELFIKTDENFSIYELKKMDERKRKSIISQVKRKLNTTLTSQWSYFRLENKEALEIDIDFKTEKRIQQVEQELILQNGEKRKQIINVPIEKHYLKFDIIERDTNGIEHFFYIKNRSKGFFWFFNFVMKLEFNPDKAGDLDNAIYLLDEPGSYLHPYAQTKLCKKIKEISEENIVIFSTHSHYLLNPEIIPLNKIHVINKNDSGDIGVQNFYQYKTKKNTHLETAFQTINDALYIKPFDIDISNKKVLIVEGIYDYYSFSLFKENREFGILPGKGASSLVSFISLMIAFEIKFQVLWDNDDEGRDNLRKATQFFGEEIAKRHFKLLPLKQGNKRILQDLFASSDLHMISKDLGVDNGTSFEKKISGLHFSDKRDSILAKVSSTTKENFDEIFSMLKF